MRTKFKAGDWVYCHDFNGSGANFERGKIYKVSRAEGPEHDAPLLHFDIPFEATKSVFAARFTLTDAPMMLNGATEYEEAIAFEELVNGGTQ